MDDQAYLQPDFDPSTLTVPRLRSILVAHNITYPSSAKKPQLIEIFNDEVRPQARALRNASARVKRTSRGIIDVASQGNPAADDDDDEGDEDRPPPPPSTSRSSKRASRARTEEPQEVAQSARAMRHSTAPPEGTPRRTSSKQASRTVDRLEEEDHEPGPRRTASKKSRLSAATPSVKKERVDDDSPFSAENVFQSGSSPPPQSHETERRRTTLNATSKNEDRRRSDALRKRMEEARPGRTRVSDAIAPTRRTYEVPLPVVKREEEDEEEDVEPTEEFTPEEEQALVQAQRSGEVVPARRRAKPAASSAALNGVFAVGLALMLGCAALWCQEKAQVGYCGVGHASSEIAGVEIPEWADIIRPRCEPCPPHAALCDDNFRTTCEPGFVLVQHPLSLGGQLPFPPTCEPDTVTTKKVNSVKQKAVEELRTQNAKYECGKASTAALPETSLKARISAKRRRGMTNEEFEALWDSALPEIRNADEVSSGTVGSSGTPTLRSRSLAALPLACVIRRSLLGALKQYLWQLVGLALLASSGLYGRHRLISGRATEARAQQLARLALEKLSLQASLHATEPGVYRDAYLPMAQLRDDVLRDEFSSVRRGKLWDQVQRKVERNANVRPMVREGRSGEVGRVWEWIGAIGMLESPASRDATDHEGWRRRTSAAGRPRVSFGGGGGGDRYIEDSTPTTVSPAPAADATSPSSLVRGDRSSVGGTWEEARRYF